MGRRWRREGTEELYDPDLERRQVGQCASNIPGTTSTTGVIREYCADQTGSNDEDSRRISARPAGSDGRDRTQSMGHSPMKRLFRSGIAAAILLATLSAMSRVSAQTAPTHIRTRWAADVTPEHVLPEYPRPQMVRSAWTNLNGNWDYAITAREAKTPTAWDGKILVPFPIQSQLSGVERAVSDSQRLWYRRTFR